MKNDIQDQFEENRILNKKYKITVKNPISNLQKVFESRIRLGLMSALMVNDNLDFNSLKDLLEVTDGNLASHLKSLEQQGIIEVSKQFVGRKTNTTYKATIYGRDLFRQHLEALEKLISNQ
jgi:DNA-binding HxlR family transcriptional regulator